MRGASLRQESAWDEHHLRTSFHVVSVKFGEPNVIGYAQANVTNWAEARLRQSIAGRHKDGFLCIDAARFLKLCVKKMHFPVFGVDLSFRVDDKMRLVVLAGVAHARLWVRAK